MHYIAVVNDPKAPESQQGKTFANTKQMGRYHNMSKDDFYEAIKYNQIYRFEIREIPLSASTTTFDRNGKQIWVCIPGK